MINSRDVVQLVATRHSSHNPGPNGKYVAQDIELEADSRYSGVVRTIFHKCFAVPEDRLIDAPTIRGRRPVDLVRQAVREKKTVTMDLNLHRRTANNIVFTNSFKRGTREVFAKANEKDAEGLLIEANSVGRLRNQQLRARILVAYPDMMTSNILSFERLARFSHLQVTLSIAYDLVI